MDQSVGGAQCAQGTRSCADTSFFLDRGKWQRLLGRSRPHKSSLANLHSNFTPPRTVMIGTSRTIHPSQQALSPQSQQHARRGRKHKITSFFTVELRETASCGLRRGEALVPTHALWHCNYCCFQSRAIDREAARSRIGVRKGARLRLLGKNDLELCTAKYGGHS
jgi:hypothetical protein